MPPAGAQLRSLRRARGLSMRQVEVASARLAARKRNNDYFVPISRLSDIESKNSVPNIFRLHALAIIYCRELREILGLYGIRD